MLNSFTKNKFYKNSGLTLALLLGSTSAAYAVAPLTTSGNQVLAGGQQTSFAGPSLFWSNTGTFLVSENKNASSSLNKSITPNHNSVPKSIIFMNYVWLLIPL